MANETLIPVEKYAAQHRLSIYTVIQKANRGELPSKVEEKDGKKVTYIVVSDASSAAAAERAEGVDYKAAYEALQKEMAELREKAIKGE